MNERSDVVTMRGNPVTLVGKAIKKGDTAPDFVVIDNNLSPVQFSSYRGKICIISSVPSLDTPVCDLETKTFNDKAAELGPGVLILTISMDLPFAQKRWCAASNAGKVQTLSDHRDASFGTSFGMLIKEFRLLARGVFIVDQKGKVQYTQIVKEIADEPDYEAIWKALDKLL